MGNVVTHRDPKDTLVCERFELELNHDISTVSSYDNYGTISQLRKAIWLSGTTSLDWGVALLNQNRSGGVPPHLQEGAKPGSISDEKSAYSKKPAVAGRDLYWLVVLTMINYSG